MSPHGQLILDKKQTLPPKQTICSLMNTAALFQQLCHMILAGTLYFQRASKLPSSSSSSLPTTLRGRSHFSPEQGDIMGQDGSGMGAVVGRRAWLPQYKLLFFKAHVRGRG